MSSVAHSAPQNDTIPTIYRWQRRFFAASIMLGPVAILFAAFANPPITVLGLAQPLPLG